MIKMDNRQVNELCIYVYIIFKRYLVVHEKTAYTSRRKCFFNASLLHSKLVLKDLRDLLRTKKAINL